MKAVLTSFKKLLRKALYTHILFSSQTFFMLSGVFWLNLYFEDIE